MRRVFTPRSVQLVAGALLLACGAVAAACGSAGTGSTLTPITGFVVRAESLTAGKGCGVRPEQIFKYAVVAYRVPSDDAGTFSGQAVTDAGVSAAVAAGPVAAGVYDCFADGSFVSVEGDLSARFHLEVYAFNQLAYQAAGGDAVVPPSVFDRAALRAANPTWSTTCAAIQMRDVQPLATCAALTPGVPDGGEPPAASVVVDVAELPASDGGVLRCGTDYVTVRTRSRVGGAEPGPVTETPCAEGAVRVSPAVAPATYIFDVAALWIDGTVVGEATCTAPSSPGLTTSATCTPAR